MRLKQTYLKVVFWVLAAAVLILSVIPGSVTIRHSIENLDKVAHFGAFFVLSILLLFAYKLTKPFLTTAFLMAVFGFSIELLHLYVPRRFFSMYDFAADLVGVAVALCIYWVITNKFQDKYQVS